MRDRCQKCRDSSPLWQTKQVVTINNQPYIDCCMVFGCHTSARIWCTFFSLVLWIAIHVKGIKHLLVYMDDTFTADTSGCWHYYQHPGLSQPVCMPADQATLLKLWDTLGIAHKLSKQLFGPILPIIGFIVDLCAMSFTLSKDSHTALVHAIQSFLALQDCCNPLRE